MSRPTYQPLLRNRIYRTASNVAFGLVVLGLATAGAAWIWFGKP